LSNDASYGWTLTSNLRILRKNTFYHIVVNRREKAERTTGKPMFSSQYTDKNSAEKAAFEFRHSNEAGPGKRKVVNWLDFNQRLLNGDLTLPPTDLRSGNSSKKAMAVKCSGARKKSLEMSAAIKYLESAE
jgi:hypothetical protein